MFIAFHSSAKNLYFTFIMNSRDTSKSHITKFLACMERKGSLHTLFFNNFVILCTVLVHFVASSDLTASKRSNNYIFFKYTVIYKLILNVKLNSDIFHFILII